MVMAFDKDKLTAPLKVEDVGGALLDRQLMAVEMMAALRKLEKKTGADLAEEIETMKGIADRTDRTFDDLTGYVSDAA